MTQELVAGVLLTGVVGLIWVMALALLSGDHVTPKRRELRVSSEPTGRPTV